MIPQIAGLTDQGIREYVDNLKYQNTVAIMWADIAKTQYGEFIINQIKKDLEFWRSQYSQIDAGSQAASNMLSFIQGIELYISRFANRLSTAENMMNSNMNEIESINEFLQLREKQKISQSLLPTGYEKRRVK